MRNAAPGFFVVHPPVTSASSIVKMLHLMMRVGRRRSADDLVFTLTSPPRDVPAGGRDVLTFGPGPDVSSRFGMRERRERPGVRYHQSTPNGNDVASVLSADD